METDVKTSQADKTGESATPENDTPEMISQSGGFKAKDSEDKETPPAETKPKKDGVQKRIDRAVRQKHEEARARVVAETKVEMLEKQLAETKASPEPENKEPQPGDFTSEEEYNQAMIDHRVEKKVAEGLAAEKKKDLEKKVEVARTEKKAAFAKSFETMKAEGTKKYDDFIEVVFEGGANNSFPLSDIMMNSALKDEKAADILYYLANNPDKAFEIAKIEDVVDQAEAMAELKRTFKPKTSKAPPPIKPIGGEPVVKKDLKDMTLKEFIKHRDAEEQKRFATI